MTLIFQHEALTHAPIVCDFTDAPDTPEERLNEYAQLFGAGLISRERTTTGVTLTFDARVASWVADLAAREAACCPFMSYRVTHDDETVRWETSGPTQAQPILDEYYELYQAAATASVDDLIVSLATRGFNVTRSSDDRFQHKQPHDHPNG